MRYVPGLMVLTVVVFDPMGVWLAGQNPAGWAEAAPPAAAARRIDAGLLVLYDFAEANGPGIKDRSGVGEPVDLRIDQPQRVRRRPGSLQVTEATLIRSEKPASRLFEALRRSNALTVEAWIRPASTRQEGPARMVTLSRDSGARNFTLGQDKDIAVMRLRTTRTSTNGIPSLDGPSGSLKDKLTHVVYTRDRRGQARLVVDGKEVAKTNVAGELTNWDRSYHLALANELSGDRPWLGTFHLVAIYDRALSQDQIEQNLRAGADARLDPAVLAQREREKNARHFETRIAPLLARHCLECHDGATREGDLNLARQDAALAGGESGAAIVPGKLGESLLWKRVANDAMPKKRPPLSKEEKQHLRQWITAGAPWTLDNIDPAAYVHDGHADTLWLQRLTVPEYIETVRSAVGVDIGEEARAILPRDLRADGFNNTAYNLNVDLGHVEAYAQLARRIVERMDIAEFAGRFSKRRDLDEQRMRELIAPLGKWLLRGPLDADELDAYVRLSRAVADDGGNFEETVRSLVEAMLQSPRFIYRVERQTGDGRSRRVGPYELASRMSYILWGGPPDEPLMRAADEGKLADRQQVLAHVERMLKDPRAMERSAQFAEQWLHLDRLENLRPDPKRFPDWDPKLAADMRAETVAFFKEIAWRQNRPLSELFNAQFTFATPRLAEHYGLKRQGGDKGLTRYELADVPGRGGLLTQGSVLTVGGDEASMVSRGLFVMHDVLRGVVKDPPPCVDTTPVPTRPGLSQRSIAEARLANKACGGCHGKFEPLAFALERFDGLGAFHERDEHDNQLRDDGQILIPGASRPVAYKSSAELMNLLADSDRVRYSLTWKMVQFALGRPLGAGDVSAIDEVHKAAGQRGGTYAAVITAIVTSDLVQTTRTQRN